MWSLLAGIAGAVLATLLRECIEWWRRPNLHIDFEDIDGRKPYVLDQPWGLGMAGLTSRARILRLSVRNTGQKPAMACEAKLVISKAGNREPLVPIVHWSRRDPAVYETLDQVYAPVHLAKGDEETLDLLCLPYWVEDASLGPGATIQTISPKEYHFERNVVYCVKLVIHASNTISRPFAIRIRWDGTLHGFDESVRSVEGSGPTGGV